MAKEQAHAFVQKLINDTEFNQQIAQHASQHPDVFSYIKELGYDFDETELRDALPKMELSDEDLERFSGGTGDQSGGSLAALLLAAGGAIAAAIISATSSNDFDFVG